MKKVIVTMVVALIATGVTLAQQEKKANLWGNVKFNSSTPGMFGGGMWSANPSLTMTLGLNVGDFSFYAFRTNDLLDKSTNGNLIDLSISWGKKLGNWKVALASDMMLFDNRNMDMLIPRVIGTYAKGNFSVEGMVCYCPLFKGGSMSIARLSPAVRIEGYTFRLFIWEKYANETFSTPMALQISKKLFQFSNGGSVSADVAYHFRDATAKKLESWGWCSINVNF